MTLIELKDAVDRMIKQANLQHLDPECVDVLIKHTKPNTIGGTSCVDVSNIRLGIDWDNGRCIIYPQKHLVVISDDDLKEWQKSSTNAGWDYFKKMGKL